MIDPFRDPPARAALEPEAGPRPGEPALAWLERVLAGSRALAGELGTSELLEALARQLSSSLGAERTAVAATPEQEVVRVARHGWSAAPGALPEVALAELLRWAARRGEAWRSNDPGARLPQGGPRLADLGWRSALVVPALSSQGRAVAVLLAVDRRGGGPFGALEERLTEILALHTAVAVERALLLERLEDWSTSLEALLAFSAAANQHLEPAQLVRHLVEHAGRFLKASGGLGGVLRTAEDGEPELVSDGFWLEGAWFGEARRWRRGQGLPGLVLETEFPYLANDYPREAAADPRRRDEHGVERALCVPIKTSDGRVQGFFELHRSAASPDFTWQEAAFVDSLANTTAVAIENAQLLSALEAKTQQVRNLSAHNLTRLEEERRYIARELHDEAGQALVGVKLGLQVMARLVPEDRPELRDQLDQLRDEVHTATLRIKDLARRLRPPTLDELGLAVALAQLANEYQHRAGLPIRTSFASLDERLPRHLETALYRVAQEALTNVVAHAGATRVELSLAAELEALRLSVTDDGCGFDAETVHAGLGLLGMRERVSMLGGALELRTQPGAGTQITVLVPWSPHDADADPVGR